MSQPVVTLLTDYGLQDEFVGVCHGVIAGICPAARIIDVTHGIEPQDVLGGAVRLAAALPYLPVGVHVAVVDPGVGSERRAVALGCGDGRILVGPDNGLLWLGTEAAGGVSDAVDISASPVRMQPVSATFHGRDIFAPVAAHLAAGSALGEAGHPIDPEELVRVELTRASRDEGAVVAHVQYIDGFGNVQLDAGHEDLAGTELKLGRPVTVGAGGELHPAIYARTFADVPSGGLLVYEDAHRRLAVAVSHGDAARRLGVAVNDELRIAPR